MSEFPQISNSQVIVGRKGQRNELKLNLELKRETIDREKLISDLTSRFQGICQTKADKIEFVTNGTIS